CSLGKDTLFPVLGAHLPHLLSLTHTHSSFSPSLPPSHLHCPTSFPHHVRKYGTALLLAHLLHPGVCAVSREVHTHRADFPVMALRFGVYPGTERAHGALLNHS